MSNTSNTNVQEVPGGFEAPGAMATSAAIGAAGAPEAAAGTDGFSLPSFSKGVRAGSGGPIELLKDVDLSVKIELGRTKMLIEDVLRLAEGAVVELDKLAGDPVDVFVNDQLVARGEVLVLNDNFCVRINEIVAPLGEQ
jgi:flagellar motor switch protein FliN/FliY